jgi:dienelactone hydrolase
LRPSPTPRLMRLPALFTAVLLAFVSSATPQDAPSAPAASTLIREGATFDARDSLNCNGDTSADEAACLAGLAWPPAAFTISVEPPVAGYGDWLIRFPSPAPTGDAINDRVAMEWYMARGEDGQPIRAPAVVVVHESGRGMVAGRMFARGLRKNGFHTFLIHLPGYGARTSEFTMDFKRMLPAFRQAIADVRRAKDAVAVLPDVDPKMIGLHGTSLGGFVVATVSGLDHGYDKAFIMLAGGQLADVLLQGGRDAAALHKRLAAVGVDDEQIKTLSQIIEPMRLANRVDAKRTWLFSGKFDEVVPPACSLAFAKAAKLGANHLVLPVGHYTAALMFPMILPKVAELMRER